MSSQDNKEPFHWSIPNACFCQCCQRISPELKRLRASELALKKELFAALPDAASHVLDKAYNDSFDSIRSAVIPKKYQKYRERALQLEQEISRAKP